MRPKIQIARYVLLVSDVDMTPLREELEKENADQDIIYVEHRLKKGTSTEILDRIRKGEKGYGFDKVNLYAPQGSQLHYDRETGVLLGEIIRGLKRKTPTEWEGKAPQSFRALHDTIYKEKPKTEDIYALIVSTSGYTTHHDDFFKGQFSKGGSFRTSHIGIADSNDPGEKLRKEVESGFESHYPYNVLVLYDATGALMNDPSVIEALGTLRGGLDEISESLLGDRAFLKIEIIDHQIERL